MSDPERSWRIAIVSTPHIKTPPSGFGGSEQVAGGLAHELARRGYPVTLFATADSHSPGRLEYFPSALPESPYADPAYREVIHLSHALAQEGFDLVLNHCLKAVPALALYRQAPVLTTLHYHPPILDEFPWLRYVAVSERQATLARNAGLNVAGVAYNGIDPSPYHPTPDKEDYLLWVGRFHYYKAPDLAIEVARRLGLRLLLAAPPPPEDQRAYFEGEVRPRLGGPVEWIGAVEGQAKYRLFERARCTLCPLRWEEPFGLVMVESMAAGTPVVAFRRGAAPEVVAHGETGFVVDGVEGMVEAVRHIETIDPAACRRRVEAHFTASAMTDRYLALASALSDP